MLQNLSVKRLVAGLTLLLMAILLIPSSTLASEPLSLTFEEALDLAVENHPQVLAARQSLEIVERDLAIAKGVFAPNLSIGATPLYRVDAKQASVSMSIRNNTTLPMGVDTETILSGNIAKGSQSLSLGVNTSFDFGLRAEASVSRNVLGENEPKYDYRFYVNQPLFTKTPPLASLQQVENTELQLESANEAVWLAQQRAKIDLYDRLFRLETTRLRLEFSKASLERVRQSYEDAQSRYEIGAANEIDLLSAKINVRQAELNFQRAERSYQQLVNSIKEVLGLDSNAEVEFPSVINLEIASDLLSENEYIARRLATAASLKQAEQAVERAKDDLDSTRRIYGPTGNVTGGYSINQQFPEQWVVMLNISYPLASPTKIHVISEKEQNLEVAIENYEAEKARLEAAIRSTFTQIKDIEQEIEIAQLNYERSLLEKLRGEQLFERNLSDEETLRQLEQRLKESQLDLLEKEHNFLVQVMELNLLIGESVSFY